MNETKKLAEQNVVYEEEISSFESFPKVIKSKRNKWGLNATSLPQMMGIDYDVFKGKCNGNRPATRDFVIAVCAILLMDSWEVCEALRSHKLMFPALDEENERDSCIINFLDSPKHGFPDATIISDLNNALLNESFSELDIIDHRNGTGQKERLDGLSTQYMITGYRFQMTDSNGYALYGDQYDSLATEYGLDRARCLGYMRIESNKTKEICHLRCSSEGDLALFDSQHEILPRHFLSIQESGEYAPFFSKLKSMTRKYQRKLIDRLDDTRNYGERVSAHLIQGKAHIFAEKYNYRFPEANEYYVDRKSVV